MRLPTALLIAVLVCAGTLPAQAQAARRDSAVTRIPHGQGVRLSVNGLGRLEGKAGARAGDSLDVAQGDSVRRIATRAIDSIWVRGRATTTGAIIGGAFGILAGAYLGALGSGLCEYDCSDTETAVITGGLVGGAFFGGLGAWIGWNVPKWQRRFP